MNIDSYHYMWRESEFADLICAIKGHRPLSMISGFFNPIHIGHLELIKSARRKGSLLAIVNGDNAARQKSGYSFMPVEQRLAIVSELRSVDFAIDFDTRNVVKALQIFQPDYFCQGGDVTEYNMNEDEKRVCKEIGCEIVYNIGGKKECSSSSLLGKYNEFKHK